MDIRSYYQTKEEEKKGIEFKEPTLTQQHFKEECDINNIMDRYRKTGYLVDPLQVRTSMPKFEDFTEVPSFHEAQILIAKSKESFEALPSHIRKRFNNDAMAFVDFCTDPENKDEMIKLGLLPEPPTPIQLDPDPGSTKVTEII